MFDVKHQRICLNELYKLMEIFFSNFEFWAENQFFFKKNNEEWILIKLQCVIYQCIRFNKLYKLIKVFKSVFEILGPKTENFDQKQKNIQKNSEAWILNQIAMCCISMDLFQWALQTNEKFFSYVIFLKFWPKYKNIETNREAWILFQSELYYISMDLAQQALQTNVKLLFKFRNNFLNWLQ